MSWVKTICLVAIICMGIIFNSAMTKSFAQTSSTQPLISSLPGFGGTIIITPGASQSNQVLQTGSTTTPDTQITAATDGSGNSISNSGSTSSRTITFKFVSTSAQGSSVSFLCALDPAVPTPTVLFNNQQVASNGFAACASPQSYFSISPGQHTFFVSALETVGGQTAVDPTPASFTWTVTGASAAVVFNTTTTDTASQAAKQIADSNIGALNAQKATSAIASQGATQNLQALAKSSENNLQQVTNLAPPIKRCDDANNDLAVYKFQGSADLRRLLQSAGPQLVPISLVIYVDTNPDTLDQKNLIINKNNIFIVAKLVSFPGQISRERVSDVVLNKIDTECTTTTLIDKTQVLGGHTPGGPGTSQNPSKESNNPPQRAAIIPRPDKLNPIWQTCTLPQGASKVAKVVRVTSPTASAQTSVPLSQGANNVSQFFTSAGNAAANAASLSGASVSNGVVNLGTSSPAQVDQQPQGTNFPVDVAKYVIRGLVNPALLTNLKNKQNFELTVYNNLDPTKPPPAPYSIEDSNLFLAGKFQINPGQVPIWQVSDYFIKEITTACKQIPFVSAPMQIGSNENQDFAVQPLFGRKAESVKEHNKS